MNAIAKENVLKIKMFIILGIIGGSLYYSIEVMFRGYSHISMFILGGLCFVIIGQLNEFYTWDMAILSQMIIASIVITVLELFTGLLVNKYLNLGVWDYSNLPYNLMGQICLLFSNLWVLLSLVVILLDDWLRYFIFGEDKPKYKIF